MQEFGMSYPFSLSYRLDFKHNDFLTHQIYFYGLFPVLLIVDSSIIDDNIQPTKLLYCALKGI